MFRPLLLLAWLLLPLSAAPRVWHDPAGDRTFRGEFISRDATKVTIRHTNGKSFTLNLTQLHPDDLKWLEDKHPLPGAKPDKPAPDPAAVDKNAVFDTLHFGDNRDQVLAKLKASTVVELAVDETFLGRLGLNGTFHTRKDIGGLRCKLFFDWNDAGGMREVSLQTDPLDSADYPTRLKACWTDLAKLITTLYGPPQQAAAYPGASSLQDGSFLGTHLWHLEAGGSILLGPAREDGSYTIVVRFTQQERKPSVIK